MPKSQLSSHDSAILSTLFDAESSSSSNRSIAISDKTSIQALPHISASLLPALRAREALAIRPLNNPCPTPTAIETAISELSSLIEAHPDYAPAYLNRAQATRLRLGSSEYFTTPMLPSTTLLFSDLGTAITLATLPTTSSLPISSLQADLLANAHTHRGYLLLKAASAANLGPPQPAFPPTLEGLSSTALEELASRDFALGGRYGNNTARQLSVQTNPYAKACGAIVKEALRKERDEFAVSMRVGMMETGLDVA